MTVEKELPWIAEGRKFIGLREIPGPQHEPEILQMWRDIKRGGIKDDETPWCASYVGSMLERVGVSSTRFEGASSYLTWGEKLDQPIYGCVVVFTRTGGGHVGFVVGKTESGNLLVLGGNQSDAVNIKAFSTERVIGYRWPEGYPKPSFSLPVGNAGLSTKES
ncbi:Uncharacterised protein [Citrobacter freundii]|nr:Uncharacterised protein [Citrobacter freundii]